MVEDGTPALLEDFNSMELVFAAETAKSEALEPRTLVEAKHRPNWLSWKKALEEELATLKAAGTWRLEEAPPGVNIIGSKWVFKAKKDTAGNIVRHKACLVAKGFSQIDSINYENTYTPVAKLASSCTVIAMANRLALEMHQIDIKGAYLNSKLNEDEVLYMEHPPGYKSPEAGTRVLHLVKTLYSLKQSGHRWYQKLSSIFISLGFKQCAVDQAMYFKVILEKGELTVVVVHVVTIVGLQNFHLPRSSHHHCTPPHISPYCQHPSSNHRHPDPRYLSNLLPTFITSSTRHRPARTTRPLHLISLRRNRLST